MELELVIFDMDGVIFDSEKVYYHANKLAAEKLKMDYSLDYYKQFIGAGTEPMKEQMIKDYGNDRTLIEDFLKLSSQYVHPLVERGELLVKPGFIALTDYLRAKEIPYVVASSNYRSEIEFFLDHTPVDKNGFKEIISAEDVHETKPAPEIFLTAFKKGGAKDKNKALVIEDSANGILAANRANLPVIMVPDVIEPTPTQEKQTLAILDDLNAVRSFITTH